MKLRNYQEYAVQSVFDYFGSNKGNPVIAMPTGTGKSLVIADLVRRVLTTYPDQRIMMLTHVKELIEQNHEKLITLWPTAPAGIYSAGIGRKESNYPITFGGIQSVHKALLKFGHIDLILVDECHLIPENSNTMYRKFLEGLKIINPYLKVIGLTATQYRMGLGLITEGTMFDDICCDMTSLESFNWFLDEGYLCELIPKPTDVSIDLTGVRKRGGEYLPSDLQAASDKEYITHEAVLEMLAVAHDRDHWLIFGTGVDHVNNIVTELIEQGVTAVAVHSKMSAEQRTANINLYLEGKVRALVNMGVLTTGFDAPHTDMIAMLRCTQSPGLWVQMLGRGTRTDYAGGYDLSTKQGRLDAIANSQKKDCMVLDFAGNTARLGCINDPVLPKKKGKGGGEAPVRLCDGLFDKQTGALIKECNIYIHASLRVCPHCGMEYPPQTKFSGEASDTQLIARKRKEDEPPVVEVFQVDKMFFKLMSGRGGKPNWIQLSYHCGLRTFTQPLCLEHEGFARKKSRDWWRKATGDGDRDSIPSTLDAAIERFDECRTPVNIRVWLNKKYPEILYVDYTGELNDSSKPATFEAT